MNTKGKKNGPHNRKINFRPPPKKENAGSSSSSTDEHESPRKVKPGHESLHTRKVTKGAI